MNTIKKITPAQLGNIVNSAEFMNRAEIITHTKSISEEKRSRAKRFIHIASLLTALVGLGLAQLPGSDATVIVPIQLVMTYLLGKNFDAPMKMIVTKGIFMRAFATMIGRAIAGILVGCFPLFGNLTNALTAFAVTEFLGWMIANEFHEDK
jgi:uncharacterized protein (DUF697 family)